MARTDPRPHYGENLPRVMDSGYVRVYVPDHPVANADGYALEHRKVAWDAGIITNVAQHVHHRNEVKTDNRPKNLAATTNAEHARQHLAERGTVTNQHGTWPLGRTQRERSHANYLRQKAKGNR